MQALQQQEQGDGVVDFEDFFRFADDFDIGRTGQKLGDPLPHHQVIVDDQHADF